MASRPKIIPSIRRDIHLLPVTHQNQKWLLVHDSLGYVPKHTAFPAEIEKLLSFFTGYLTWEALAQMGLDLEDLTLFEQIYFEMDRLGLLNSLGYQLRKQEVDDLFLKEDTRPMICADSVFPSDPDEAQVFFDNILAQCEEVKTESKPKALYAPHIDFNVNTSVYGKAFNPLKQVKPKHVYLIGTSHYSGLDKKYDHFPFQFSKKNYSVPGRVLRNGTEKTKNLFEKTSDFGSTDYDLSHRTEHSLELHAVWASHIWKHDFTITPILVGSFDDTLYMKDSELEKRAKEFSAALQSVITEADFILISGDLSHIGKKFGDNDEAELIFPKSKRFDYEFLQAAAQVNPDKIYDLMRSNHDAFHICGFPPLQSVLASNPFQSGKQIAYDYWDETERQSGVSFGAVLFS